VLTDRKLARRLLGIQQELLLVVLQVPVYMELGPSIKFLQRPEFKMFMILSRYLKEYGGWNFNSGNYLFTTDTK